MSKQSKKATSPAAKALKVANNGKRTLGASRPIVGYMVLIGGQDERGMPTVNMELAHACQLLVWKLCQIHPGDIARKGMTEDNEYYTVLSYARSHSHTRVEIRFGDNPVLLPFAVLFWIDAKKEKYQKEYAEILANLKKIGKPIPLILPYHA